jgi:hypothetical protein
VDIMFQSSIKLSLLTLCVSAHLREKMVRAEAQRRRDCYKATLAVWLTTHKHIDLRKT